MAKMVYRLGQAYQSLPHAGGILNQDVSLLRMHVILADGGYFDEQGGERGTAPQSADPWADIPMMAMS